MLRKLIGTVVLDFAVLSSAFAQQGPMPTPSSSVPPVVRFAGSLPLADQTTEVTFAVYEMQEGGTAVWTEAQLVAVDSAGRYGVLLGAASPEGLQPTLFASGATRWIGVTVEGQPELPRVALVSVPYAMKAADADTIGGKPLSAFVLAEPGAEQPIGTAASAPSSTPAASGAPGGSGTPGFVPRYVDTVNLGDSVIFQAASGAIGVNTAVPEVPFHSVATSAPGAFFDVFSGAGVLGTLPVVFRAARGTPSAPAAVQTNDILGGLAVRGFGTNEWSAGRGQIMFKAAEPWTNSANGTYLQMTTTPVGSAFWVERLRITPDGKVGIGTATPAQLLSVAGTIESTSGGFKFPDGTTQVTASVPTSYAAGTGLQLAGTTFSVVFGGAGSAASSARSDHTHSGTTGSGNTVVGVQAGPTSGTSSYNTVFGYQALRVPTGNFNTAIGYIALSSNTTGYNNTSVGAQASSANTTGYNNTAVGSSALSTGVSGIGNTAVGVMALRLNIGDGNTAVGMSGLAANTSGGNNSSLGTSALSANTTGTGNVAIGSGAGSNNTVGSSNTFIGAYANAAAAGLTNATAVGAGASVGASNSLVLGGSGVKVGIGTSTPAQTLSAVGVIESTTGGFKFPDGTVQLTAATSGPSYAAGAGLNLAGTTFSVSFGSNGTATTVARGDHYHGDMNSANTTVGFLAGVAGGFSNTAFGSQALNANGNTDNTAVGKNALQVSATQGNTAVGSNAIPANAAGFYNTAVGFTTLAGAGGSWNAATGAEALRHNAGDANSAFGAYALNTNSTGGANAAVGFHALHSNSTGNYNSAFGESALYSATASENTALGRYALNQTTTGAGNTAAGLQAGNANVNGTYNTFIGWKADADSSHQGLTYATAVGAGAVVTQDYSIALGAPNGVTGAVSVGIGTSAPTAKLEVVGGDVKVTGGMLFADNVGIGTTTPGYQLHVVGTARVTDTLYVKCAVVNGAPTGSCPSDARFKRDVQPFGSVLDRVALLQPVHYYWRAEEFPDRHFEDVRATGLIAQDVERLFPEMVSTDDKGFKQLDYGEVPYLTLAAVKELKAKSDRLEAENAAMKAENATLAARLEALEQLQKQIVAALEAMEKK